MALTQQRWRRQLYIFPYAAGTTWFIMLTTLLFYWLFQGRPRFPLQSNPYVAFISDIGAFTLKPLFITFSAITSLTFMATIACVHYVRYSPQFCGFDDTTWKKAVSVLALVSGVVAGTSLFLLAVFDTYRFHVAHGYLLLGNFCGLGMCMLATVVVWWDQTWWPSPYPGLRRWCMLSNIIFVIELTLGIAFTVLMWNDYLRIAGILEWIITYMGGFYLLVFGGYLRYPETISQKSVDGETQPLLSE